MYEDIVESLRSSRVVEKSGYRYFIHPLSNGVPSTDPALVDTVSDWMQKVGNLDCDLILAPESMGIPYAVALSLKTGVPYSVVKKRSSGLDGEIELIQRTGYSKSTMYVNGVTEGTRVVIVDDVVSTGGTLNAIIQAVTDVKAVVVDVLVVINKDGGASKVTDGPRIKTLFDVNVTDDGVSASVSPGVPSD